MLLCKYCISAIKSRGEKLWVGGSVVDAETAEEKSVPCDWCQEFDELFCCEWR